MKKENLFVRFKAWFIDHLKWLFDIEDWKLLFRSIPGLVTCGFVISVVVMNLMASKVIIMTSFMGITGGVLLSWLPFLTMDTVVKTFGLKAANKLTLLGLIVNLACIGIFQLVSVIQVGGDASSYAAFDATFSQTWQIFVASSIAFLVSGVVNNASNVFIAKLVKKNPDGKVAYMLRTYISTAIGQFVDNFIFAGLAFMVFFQLSIGSSLGYTWLSVLGTAAFGALLELLMEVIFSPIGYRICQKWRKEAVGEEYLAYCQKMELHEDVGRLKY